MQWYSMVGALALATAAGAGTAQAKVDNLISDGSFESAAALLGARTYCHLADTAQDCGRAGWRGTAALLQAADATLGNPASPYGTVLAGVRDDGRLEQQLNLPTPGRYTLSWFDAGATAGAGAQAYRVSFDGVTLDAEQVSSGAAWQRHTVTFDAAGPGLLRFQGSSAQGGAIAYIDNVSLTAPALEPSGYSMLLVGLALLAFTRRGKATPKFIN